MNLIKKNEIERFTEIKKRNLTPKILHLTYDLRDRLGNEKTVAVKNLITSSEKFSTPFVVDLVRVTRFRDEFSTFSSPGHFALNCFGMPKGIFLLQHLNRAYREIRNTMAVSGSGMQLHAIDIVHAHKLTFEGYIGSMLCQELNIPLLLTLRQTDLYVLKYRPDLHRLFKRILMLSSIIFYLVPNILVFIKKRLGNAFYHDHIERKVVYLPNIVKNMSHADPSAIKKNELLTITRMTKESVKRKNLKNLFKAIKLLDGDSITLNVVGDGKYLPKVKKLSESYGANKHIVFCGAVNNKKIHEHFNRSLAFVMPSYSESFGMVYAEALMCGTPIIFSKGVLGFEGVFKDVGIGVNPNSVEDIKNGIDEIIKSNQKYRATISKLNRFGAFDIFSSRCVVKTYKDCIERIL